MTTPCFSTNSLARTGSVETNTSPVTTSTLARRKNRGCMANTLCSASLHRKVNLPSGPLTLVVSSVSRSGPSSIISNSTRPSRVQTMSHGPKLSPEANILHPIPERSESSAPTWPRAGVGLKRATCNASGTHQVTTPTPLEKHQKMGSRSHCLYVVTSLHAAPRLSQHSHVQACRNPGAFVIGRSASSGNGRFTIV